MGKGRPKKKHGLLDDQILVRVMKSDRKLIDKAADSSEMETADWVRMVLKNAAEKQLK